MKILCICHAGTVRSGSMAFYLKHCGHDALTLSTKWNSLETKIMLCQWADKIFIMDETLNDGVFLNYKDKVVITNVGQDVWFNPLAPDLLEKCEKLYLEVKDKL